MGESRLSASELVRVFPGGAGVHGISLQLAPGSIHALVALNGGGKTTLMRLLLGMLQPDSGTVRIDGRYLHETEAATWQRVGHFVEHPFAYADLDTRANLTVAARLRGVPRDHVPEVVERALAEFDLERYAPVRARVLSQGNRQRLGLASALQHAPDLLVLDEPTNALDPAGVLLLRATLQRRVAQGAAVLVSSHHLDEVSRLADQITVLNRGRAIGSLDPAGVDIERRFFDVVAQDERRWSA